jgi:hypothetical protein
MKFKNIYNTKKKLQFTIKNDDYKKEVVLYLYDSKSEDVIRVVTIKKAYLLKVLSNL